MLFNYVTPRTFIFPVIERPEVYPVVPADGAEEGHVIGISGSDNK